MRPARCGATTSQVPVPISPEGLVRESRQFQLESGTGEIRITDVAARLDPTTVHLVPRRSGSFLTASFRRPSAS